MNYSSTSVRTCSLLGQTRTFGAALLDMAQENEKIIVLTSDLGKTTGLERFWKILPEQFVNTGIAEQNMVAVAAGLASEGFVPFAVSFACFSSMRACEPARHFLGY